MTEFDLKNTAANLVYNVESSYWNLVYAHESMNAYTLALAQAESLLAYNETAFGVGLKTDSDVLEAKSAMIIRKQDVADQKKNILDIEDKLAYLLNFKKSAGKRKD